MSTIPQGAVAAVASDSSSAVKAEQANATRPKGTSAVTYNPSTTQFEPNPHITTEQQTKAEAIQQQKEEGVYQTPGGTENTAVKSLQNAKDQFGISYVSGGGGAVDGGMTARDLYVADILNEYSKGFISGPAKDRSNSPEQRLGDLLGQVGLSYNKQTKTITDPLMEKISAGDIGGGDVGPSSSWSYHDTSSPIAALARASPGTRATKATVQPYVNELSGLTNNPDRGVKTKKSEELQSSLGQEATGYIKKDSSGNVIPEYSSEQVASLIASKTTNKEYGGNVSFLASNIGTENSTGPSRMGEPKSNIPRTDISSAGPSESNPFVISGGHILPAGLVYTPSQEAIDKANMARAEIFQVQEGLKRNDAILRGVENLAAYDKSIQDIISGAPEGTKSIDVFEAVTNKSSLFPAHDKNLKEVSALSFGPTLINSSEFTPLGSISISDKNAKQKIESILSSGKQATLFYNNTEKPLTSNEANKSNNEIAFAKVNQKGIYSPIPFMQDLSSSKNPVISAIGKSGLFSYGVAGSILGLTVYPIIQGLNERYTIEENLINRQNKPIDNTAVNTLTFAGTPGLGIAGGVSGVIQGRGLSGFGGGTGSKEFDVGYLVGDVGTLLLLGGPAALKSLSPIKVGERATIRFEGIGNIPVSKALPSVTVQGEKTISASGVALGYGKYTVGIGFKTSEGEALPFISTLNPATDLRSTLEKFTAISPRGAEAGYVTPLTISKIYTPTGAATLQDLGKITSEQQADLINPASDVMKAITKIKDVNISQTELTQMIQQTGLTDNPETAAKITGVVATVQNPGKTALAYMTALKAGDKQLADALKPFLNPLNAFPATKGSIVNILQLTKYNADKSIADLMLQEKVGSLGHGNLPEDNLIATRPLKSMGDLMDVDLKSEKQSEQLLNVLNASHISDEGFGFGRSGLNITYGKAEEVFRLPKTKLKSNEALHGTAESGAANLVKKGPELTPEKQLFMTRNQELAEHYGLRELQRTGEAPRFVKMQFEQGKILKFNELTPEEQKYLTNDALNISKQEGISKYQGFQKAMKQYAETKGFAGYEKPYDVRNPLNINAKQSEIVIFNQEGLKGINSIINPAVTKEVKNGDELLNLLGKKDEIGSELSVLSKGKAFGISQPSKTIKQGSGLKTKTLAFQGWAKLKSVTSYQNLKTLNEYKEAAAPEIYEKAMSRFKGMEMIIRTPFIRDKDVVDALSILRYGEKTVGGKAGRRMGEYANNIQKHFSDIDFSIANKEVESGRITITNIPKTQSPYIQSTTQIIKSPSSQSLAQKSLQNNINQKPKSKQTKEELKSISTSKVSAYEKPSVNSLAHTSKTSVLESRGSYNIISPKSVTSTSLKSSNAPSPKSISSTSITSSFSPTSPTSSFSPTSPTSPTSPLSPTSPTSPKAPSFKSPIVPTSVLSKSESISNSIFSVNNVSVKPPVKKPGILDIATKPDERTITKKVNRFNYIGNSTESTLVGLYNRQETIYGKARTAKLSQKDYLRTTKGFPKLVNTKTTGLITTKKTFIGRKETKTKNGVPKF